VGVEVWVLRGDGVCPGVRIAVIRPRRHAVGLCARWVGSAQQIIGCCFFCFVIQSFELFLILNSSLQDKLSGIPVLRGRCVALKQSYTQQVTQRKER